MSQKQYVDSSGRVYEGLPQLVGHVVHTVKMKIASTTIAKGVATFQYLAGIPAEGIRVVGGCVDVTLVQTGSATLVVSVGTPKDPDRFMESNNGAAGHAASFVEDFANADVKLTDPVIEATDITTTSPAVICVKLEERHDVAGDSLVVSGFVYLDYINLAETSARMVRKSDGSVDTDRT